MLHFFLVSILYFASSVAAFFDGSPTCQQSSIFLMDGPQVTEPIARITSDQAAYTPGGPPITFTVTTTRGDGFRGILLYVEDGRRTQHGSWLSLNANYRTMDFEGCEGDKAVTHNQGIPVAVQQFIWRPPAANNLGSLNVVVSVAGGANLQFWNLPGLLLPQRSSVSQKFARIGNFSANWSQKD